MKSSIAHRFTTKRLEMQVRETNSHKFTLFSVGLTSIGILFSLAILFVSGYPRVAAEASQYPTQFLSKSLIHQNGYESAQFIPATVRVPSTANELSIKSGYRAISLPVGSVSGIEGHILPGSRVDVASTLVDPAGVLKTTIVSENAVVLSYGGHTDTAFAKQQTQRKVFPTVTLGVNSTDAMKIVMLQEVSQLTLFMRNSDDTGSLRIKTVTAGDINRKYINGPYSNRKAVPKEQEVKYCPYSRYSRLPLGTRMYSVGTLLPNHGNKFIDSHGRQITPPPALTNCRR